MQFWRDLLPLPSGDGVGRRTRGPILRARFEAISTVMVRRLGACVLSALLCFVVLAAPVRATEPADEFVALPFATYEDMLVDAAHGQVFVTGGRGYNEIAVVHVDGSGVTMIPNAPGAGELTMAEDGSHV